jgi:hypothetical protein
MTKVAINPETIKTALLTESMNGVFTAISKITGKDFTYKVKQSEFNGRTYTHVFVEQGYLEFKHIGTYFNGKVFKKRNVVDTPTAKGIAWILSNVLKGEFSAVNKNVELLHLGKCLKCNRTLTDAESISIGLGPVCRGDH